MILIVVILALKLPHASFDYLYRSLTLSINGISADGRPYPQGLCGMLIPGYFSVYYWRFHYEAYRISKKDTIKTWWKRAPKRLFNSYFLSDRRNHEYVRL
jgi:lactate permease